MVDFCLMSKKKGVFYLLSFLRGGSEETLKRTKKGFDPVKKTESKGQDGESKVKTHSK